MRLKILLIGPYPPPHGGISVHVLALHRLLTEAGVCTRVLEMTPEADARTAADRFRHWLRLIVAVLHHARQGWIVHLHTNGHNRKSWIVAAVCGVAGSTVGSVLTLHSGLVSSYLGAAGTWRRMLARFACSRFTRVVCVSPEIQLAVSSLGVPVEKTEILPAYLGAIIPERAPSPHLMEWLRRHSPVISAALFFRPEYGFELLAGALARLKPRYPRLGCVVMGSGEQRRDAQILVRLLALENHLLLLGDVPHDTCLALMSASDVFVRPTLCDGDSVSVREALSLGVPVVASAAGTRPTGVLLFEPGNAEDLFSKLETALASPPAVRGELAGGGGRLLEIYRQMAAWEMEHAAT